MIKELSKLLKQDTLLSKTSTKKIKEMIPECRVENCKKIL
jgi:hypothetical protein